MNRLEEALYNPSSAGPGVGAQDIFSVSGITYDGIGNIMTLNRQGITQCGGPGGAELVVSAIDQLAYTYANGSRLSEVVDNATHPDLKDLGVKNGGGTYQYDAAGRMTHDNHRGLVIEYNHLDLPRRITDQNNVVTDITYDATGRKWLQQTTTDARIYAGSVVLTKENGTYSLEAANTSDGRLVYDAEAVEVYPEFYHKDHLGNVRVAFADRNKDLKIELLGPTSEITQQNDYYPFGLRQEGDSLVFHQGLSSNRYLYNGKEFSEELGLYDYGARWYDVAIGRWTSIDPLAKRRISITPYNYVQNNPILRIDPNGLTDYTFNTETGKVEEVKGSKDKKKDRLLVVQLNTDGSVARNEKGKIKTKSRMSVAKGILSDGMNLKEDDHVIEVGADSEPSVTEVEDFMMGLSQSLEKEIGGGQYSEGDSDEISYVTIGKYKLNSATETQEFGFGDGDAMGGRLRAHVHTHLPGYYASGNDQDPSPEDEDIRDAATDPTVRFKIITARKKDGYRTRSHKYK